MSKKETSTKITRPKRISFVYYEIAHLYEMVLGYPLEDCPLCKQIEKKLKKFLGERTIRSIKRTIKKYPY